VTSEQKPGTAPEVERLAVSLTRLAENMKAIYRQQCQSERVVVFMDNSNFFGSVARIGKDRGYKFRVDYHKLFGLLLRDRFCIDARCYYNDWESDPETRQRRENYRSLMTKAGFTLVCSSQCGETRPQGLDQAIIPDMLAMAKDCPRCDTFILVAGDGDYADTVREVRRRFGVKVEVAFFAADTAAMLRDASGIFIDLEVHSDDIQFDRHFSD